MLRTDLKLHKFNVHPQIESIIYDSDWQVLNHVKCKVIEALVLEIFTLIIFIPGIPFKDLGKNEIEEATTSNETEKK